MAFHAYCVPRCVSGGKRHTAAADKCPRSRHVSRALSAIIAFALVATIITSEHAGAQPAPGGPAPFPGAAPPGPPAQTDGTAQIIPRGPNDDSVTLNFVNADIQAVIRAVAEITGRDILLDPRVTGTVNIIAPRPVPRSLVFSVLESALRAQGFTAVPGEGGIVRIVPEAEAKFHAGPESRTAKGDEIVTEVFHLDFEQAQQVVTALRPLV